MSSGEVLRILGTYNTLGIHIRPSELLDIEDKYTAFCFDEACAYITKRLKDGDKVNVKQQEKKVYKKPSDYYKKFN